MKADSACGAYKEPKSERNNEALHHITFGIIGFQNGTKDWDSKTSMFGTEAN